MIIAVSIVDQSKPGNRPGTYCHVGTYHFEIDYPAGPHIDTLSVVILPNAEDEFRPLLGRLLSAADIPDAVRADGSAV